MVKICHITTVHYPFDIRIFHKELKTLKKAGFDPVLIAPWKRDEKIEGIKIKALSFPKNRFSRMVFLTRKAMKLAEREKAKIYHFHDPEFLPYALRLKRKTKAKVIYDVHEDIPKQILSKEWIPRFFRPVISKIFDLYEKNISRKLDFIISAWEKIENEFKKAGIFNIETITNYPIASEFEGVKAFPFSREKIRLIYVGGIKRSRGIKEMVLALRYLKEKNIELLILGKFLEKSVKKEVEKLPEWEKVKFLGWVSRERLKKELSRADVGLYCLWPEPNHLWSLPNKVFEYMAVGLPVLASNFPITRKILINEKCGLLVDPLNPKDIAKKIQFLIEHRKIAQEMGENGRRAVFEKYNWEKESKKLIKIYEKLLKK